MSEHAHPAKEEEKKHGDALERALGKADKHTPDQKPDPVPAPEDGGRPRS